VYEPEVDWLAQANHARTPRMVRFDRARFPDSFRRLDALESAIRNRMGEIGPEVAAELLRHRAAACCNDDRTIGGPVVLNAAILQPSTRTLWHSTTMQPLAPFGEFRAFSLGESEVPPVPADPRLTNGEFEHEADVVGRMRGALWAQAQGDAIGALAIFDRLVGLARQPLDADRLAWARARALWELGDLDAADALLYDLDGDAVPFDVRAWALVMRAVMSERRKRRGDALAFAQRAEALLATGKDYGTMFLDPMRKILTELRRGAGSDDLLPPTPDLQRIPH
jgi:hypothetical protein